MLRFTSEVIEQEQEKDSNIQNKGGHSQLQQKCNLYDTQ